MNIYFLVEGEETELQLYPKWLSFLIPNITRVSNYREVNDNNYYIFSGGGIPSIYGHAVNAIKDINDFGKFDYLIVCLDSEELTIERRVEKLRNAIEDAEIELLNSCKLEIVVQNRCVETWFLGNRKVYKRNPQGDKFREYSNFYNVEINDPEIMAKYSGFSLTSHFHEAYLREMLKEYNVRYRKSRPKEVLDEPYLRELIKRVSVEPNHLGSLKFLFDLLESIKSEMD